MDVRRYTDLMSDTYLVKLLDVTANSPPILLLFCVFSLVFHSLKSEKTLLRCTRKMQLVVEDSDRMLGFVLPGRARAGNRTGKREGLHVRR